ncbi:MULTISPECIES: cytochrome C assembly family protein [unclassified Spongiibacter]|uniref:cytochrome C assembly family protein n=1 Tax=Spongiibacter TaxID=630749 RepID=UPI000C0A9065|nr:MULTISPECIES: cytochrome c biogenesis protein CcsA [unclassified Spongiibacter]MAK43628.1 phosphohydrolase [Spongiibacter sp.]|tara:strand:+ start:5553 stop:6350 length:798 start_codon:yes stop_codon:yes gene_type:complete
MNIASSLIAVLLYFFATGAQARRLRLGNGQQLSRGALCFGAIAITAHFVAAVSAIATPMGADLGLSQLFSLLTGLICAITLGASLRRPIHNLLLALFPLAILAITLELLLPGQQVGEKHSAGMYSHIILSILAYSMLTIAAVQALVLASQDRMLRQHQLRGLPSFMPPLQTMESMLFELVAASFLLLTAAIGTGVVFVDDLLGQNLAHKTLFSIMAWLLLGVLIGGRLALGWRGRTAIRWTLWAFAFLLLGYLGTKIALSLITSP